MTLTQAISASIAAAYRAGLTLEELADTYAMAPSTVRRRLRAAGVALRPPCRRTVATFGRPTNTEDA